jgi:uncharacterized protein (TIGR03435 family)
MMQSLLEDRFKLKTHRENRQMPVFGMYLLKPGKTGPQLQRHSPDTSRYTTLLPPSAGKTAADLVGKWPITCGDGSESRRAKYVLRRGGRDMSMSAMADRLTG